MAQGHKHQLIRPLSTVGLLTKNIAIFQRLLIQILIWFCAIAGMLAAMMVRPQPAQALADVVSIRTSLANNNHEGFFNQVHYFDVDDPSDTVLTIGYCMNLGRHNGEVELYDAGWEPAKGPLAYIAYNGYPNTTTIAGHPLSELGARTATAIAVYMQQGYIEPALSCDVPKDAPDDGLGGYSLSALGPTNTEVRQAALDLYQQAQQLGNTDGPWNRSAVRIYHAPSQRVQNMLVVRKNTQVTIRKVSSDAELVANCSEYALGGAIYEVHRADDDALVATVTTDEQGYATCLLEPNQNYYLREIHAPKGYVLNPDPVSFTVGDTSQEVQVANKPGTALVRLQKVDSATKAAAQPGVTLAGAVFSAIDAHGVEHRVTTDADGIAEFGNLPLGPIALHEVTPPVGYRTNTKTYELYASADQLGEAEVVELSLEEAVAEDVVAVNLEIAKFLDPGDNPHSGIERPGAGIVFEVISNSTGKVVATLTTNERGYADTSDPTLWFGEGTRPPSVSGALPYDTQGYTLHEVPTTVPVGFAHADDWHLPAEALADGAKLQYIVDNHAPSSRLMIVKIDAETGREVPLSGFSFRLEKEDGTPVVQDRWYPSHEVLEEFVTDESGSVTLPERLPAGRYRVVETHAPSPYLCLEQTITFEIPVNNAPELLVVQAKDPQATGRIAIHKTDARDGSPLAGAQFEIRAARDLTAPDGTLCLREGQLITTLTCDDKGYAVAEHLPLGTGEAIYSVIEVAAPEGFVLDPTPHLVTLTWENDTTPMVEVELTVANEPTRVRVSKVDSETGQPVADAHLALFNSEGQQVAEWVTTSEAIELNNIPVGTYQLVELAAPRTHLSIKPLEVVVTSDPQPIDVALLEEPIKISGQVDKRQLLARPVADNTLPNEENARAAVQTDVDGHYAYTIDFRSTSNTWADECTITDRLFACEQGLAEVEGITTPVVYGDADGRMNVWVRTSHGASQKDPQGPDAANATLASSADNPFLPQGGRVLSYDGWKLWAAGLSATTPQSLSVATLDLAPGEQITDIRLEYGRVSAGFTSRAELWDRDDLKHEHDDLSELPQTEADGLSPAIVHMRATANWTSENTLNNHVELDIYRNGGGDHLEDHDHDDVVQSARPAPPLPSTGDKLAPLQIGVTVAGSTLAALGVGMWQHVKHSNRT